MTFNIARLVSIMILFLVASSIIAQESKWKIRSSLAFQGTEERIFGLNKMWVRDLTQRNNDKILPSLFFDIGLEYQLISIGNFNINTGVKYAYEWNNSYRNYDHCIIEGNPCHRILLFVNGYSYHMVGSSLSFNHLLIKLKNSKVFLGVNVSSYIRFLTYYANGANIFENALNYQPKVDYLFSEILPTISFQYKDYEKGKVEILWN